MRVKFKILKQACAMIIMLYAGMAVLLAVPALERVYEFTQPDGMTLRLSLVGDELYHQYLTGSGYSAVFDNGAWRYAACADEGKSVPSDFIVGMDSPAKAWLEQAQVAYTPAMGEKLKESQPEFARALGESPKPNPVGTVNQLIILANFSDTTTTFSRSDFNGLFNTTGYSAHNSRGSVRDYFLENSYGNLTIDTTVSDWVSLPHPKSYYGANDALGHDLRPRELIEDAIAALDATGFDFSPFDANSDGWLDAIGVIHQGAGEESGGGADCIWSHQGKLITPITIDGIKIQAYHIEPETLSSDLISIGIICHNIGHLFGLPDLYDTSLNSEGIGQWGVMGTGCWLGSPKPGSQPCHFCAWSKIYLGWVRPTPIYTNQFNLTLPGVETSYGAFSPRIYKVRIPCHLEEYFLLENRNSVGFDQGVHHPGLCIWHIDNGVIEANLDANSANADVAHKGVDLEEADGDGDLDFKRNQGDGTDPYYLGNTRMSPEGFTPTSDGAGAGDAQGDGPNSLAYDGTNAGINIVDISNSAAIMNLGLLFQDNMYIVKPSETQPAYVGNYTDPIKFEAAVQLNLTASSPTDLTAADFAGEVYNSTCSAPITIIAAVPLGTNYYQLIIDPPSDAQGITDNGKYNLRIEVASLGLADCVKEAVLYTDEHRVDVVEVIDRSGSMSTIGLDGRQYVEIAKDAAKMFVDLSQLGDQIGVVDYDNIITLTYPLTLVDAAGVVKQAAKAAIDTLYARGSTSIGGGLQKGQQELLAKGLSTHPWAMVLLSDGHENTAPMWADVRGQIIGTKTNIYTVGLGIYTREDLMNEIATETNGAYYNLPAPTTSDLQDIYQKIAGSISGYQVIFSYTGQIQQGATDTETLYVDSSTARAIFQITWSDPAADVDLTLSDPNGVTYNHSYDGFSSGTTFESYTVNNPASGQWTMYVYGATIPPQYSTESKVLAGTEYKALVTAQTNLTMHAYLNRDYYYSWQPIRILCCLSDQLPITGATVSAEVAMPSAALALIKTLPTVTLPGGDEIIPQELIEPILSSGQGAMVRTTNIWLYDDGHHNDGRANDGIYGNSFYGSTEGTYKFTLQATGSSNLGEPFYRSKVLSTYVEYVEQPEPPLVQIDPYSLALKGRLGMTTQSTITVRELNGSSDVAELQATCSELTSQDDIISTENISLDIPSTVIPAGDEVEVKLTVDVPADVEPGMYSGILNIHTEIQDFQLPVALHAVHFVDTPDLELEFVHVRSDKIVDLTGNYGGRFDYGTQFGIIEFTATQDIRGKVRLSDGRIRLPTSQAGRPTNDAIKPGPGRLGQYTNIMFNMKGKLKLKKKGKELKITLKGRGKDEANKKYRLRAIGSIESQALLLHFRVRGKAIKFEFDLDVALQNSATGLTVRFDQLIARSRQKNNLQGFGVVISPCSAEQSYGVESYSSSRVKIREKIRISKRKGLIRRRYLIRGDKFKLSMHNEMNSWDDPHMTVKRVKCRLGYGKIPLSYTNISLKYFWQIQNGDGGEP